MLRVAPFRHSQLSTRFISTYFVGRTKQIPSHSASSKLFADAAAEEALSPDQNASHGKNGHALPQLRERNWDGDEPMEDTVLRMLVDKYKPMRTGVIRTADEKLKKEVSSSTPSSEYFDSPLSLDSLPPLQLPASGVSGPLKGGRSKSLNTIDPDDAKARAEYRRAKKLDEGPKRIGSAREKSFDYRIGKVLGTITPDSSTSSSEAAITEEPRRPNPASVKGWAALIEDRIEKARSSGTFDKIEGRGKPLKQHSDEGNPFIAREEFLMNRIIQRQGAAPPWVEIQGELESHIRSFREVLRSNWVRQATRTILLNLPPPPYRRRPPSLTKESVAAMRDPEWEQREGSYHDAALAEVNAQIRRHNGIAPFAARRGYLMRKYELERCYRESAEEIIQSIDEKLSDGTLVRRLEGFENSDTGLSGVDTGSLGSFRLWETLKRLAIRLVAGPAARSSRFRNDASTT
ncbi:hypothetical protein FRB99_008333 [Tulasnella sp. 403]|nr:hypothetical protein FRB99_008333 [Tulasnella sp. 403]